MKTTYNLQNDIHVITMDDIIFAGRNHAYGAFYLRKNYNKFLIRSLFITIAFVSTLFLITKLGKKETTKVIDHIPIDIGPVKIDRVDPIKLPPPVIQGPSQTLRGLLQFRDPVVVDDVPLTTSGIWVNDDQTLGGSPEGTSTNGSPNYYSDSGGGGGNPIPEDNDSTFNFLEEPAIFPIGEFTTWVKDHINYDSEMVSMGIEGTVFFQFVINKKGYPEDIKIVRSVDPALDQEVIRVISSSPKWIPGKQRGTPVKQLFTMRIGFKISK